MANIKIGDRTVKLPTSRLARIIIGVSLILGGILGFLPILGFWMIPLGLMILSVDIPAVRRWRRKVTVKNGDRLIKSYPKIAHKLGLNGKKRGR